MMLRGLIGIITTLLCMQVFLGIIEEEHSHM